VLAVLIDDKPGGLDELIQLLYKENINVENAYGFVLESWKNAVFVLDVDQEEKTRKILHDAGFKMLSADALAGRGAVSLHEILSWIFTGIIFSVF